MTSPGLTGVKLILNTSALDLVQFGTPSRIRTGDLHLERVMS